MNEPTSTEKTTKTEAAPAEKAGKSKKTSARDMLRESGKVKKAKVAKEAKPKQEKVLKGPNPVVFAFRLNLSDRDLLHRASGPAGASKFVLGAALAAATADQKAFDALVTQAKANTK